MSGFELFTNGNNGENPLVKVQRIGLVLTSTETSITRAIETVDLNKSFLTLELRNSGSRWDEGMVTVDFVDNSNISIQRQVATNELNCIIQVVQMQNIRRVQVVRLQGSSTSFTATIEPVLDPSKTVLYFSQRITAYNTTLNRGFITGTLSGNDSVIFTSTAPAVDRSIVAFVVEFE